MKKTIVIIIVIILGVIGTIVLNAKRLKTTLPVNVPADSGSVAKAPIEKSLPVNAIADKVLIEKSKRRMTLLSRNIPLKTYSISLGKAPMGKKTEEGDGRTPEGFYSIDGRKIKSSYHRALHISYPNQNDKARAKAKGVSPGGNIMIHGLPNSIGFIGRLQVLQDWTLGCIAVSNPEIEEIWRVVPDGTIVEIVP